MKWEGGQRVPFKILKGRGSGNNISRTFSLKGTVTNCVLLTVLGTFIHVFLLKSFNSTAIQ